MKTSVSHLSRWFLVVLMQVVCVIALSAQGAGGFRVYREWNFSLDYEQCRELVMAGLAVLEQENPKLCRYIDTEDGAFLHVAAGWEGVSFRGSTLRDDTRCVVITAEYQVKIPFVPAAFPMLRVKQTAVCRSFSSDRDYIPKESSEEKSETVYYMTPSGSVYHMTRECTYLKILAQSAAIEDMARMRNSSGGRYYPCKLCTEGLEVSGNVYYTSGGSSYHVTKNCSSLSRNVMEKTAEEIAGIPPCSRCAPAQVVH